MNTRLYFAAIFLLCIPELSRATEPATNYSLAVSAVEAIARLESLRDPQAPPSNQPSAAELALIERVATGVPLTEDEVAEALLLASGETDEQPRKTRREQLDDLTRDARAALVKCKSDREKAESLLTFLHKGVMSNGYEAKQTSVATVLNTGKFNCVSATALYQFVGERLGLKLQALEVPGSSYQEGHALTTLIDGERRTDIETTNPDGFSTREKASKPGVLAFGLVDLKRAREVDSLGLALAIYNNRAVDLAKKDEHLDGAILRFTMLALAPQNKELQDSAVGAISNWVAALEKSKKFDLALQVGRIGLAIAPADSGLANNVFVTYERLSAREIEAGREAALVELLAEADRAWPQAGYRELAAKAFIRAARETMQQGKWQGAISVVARGLKVLPDNDELADDIAYLTQESLAAADAKDGPAAAVDLFVQTQATFPSVKSLSEIAAAHVQRQVQRLLDKQDFPAARQALADRAALLADEQQRAENEGLTYDAEARRLSAKKEFDKAANVYRGALKKLPSNELLAHNAVVLFDAWADTFIQAKTWQKAIDIYDAGLALFPENEHLKHNRAFCQERLKGK